MLLERTPWTEAKHAIRAIAAGAASTRRLAMPKGTACLLIERMTRQRGTTITTVRLVYPGDRYRLVARFSPADAVRAKRPRPGLAESRTISSAGNHW